MKILRFNDDRIGVLTAGDLVIDISSLISHREERGPQRVMEVLIENFDALRPEIEKLICTSQGTPLAGVKLLAPIHRPGKCLGAFLNYLDSADRTVEKLPNEFFHKSPDLVGPGGDIFLRNIPAVKEVTPEAELAFVIGKHGKDIPESRAMDYVFGYVGFFDISARGLIRRSLVVPKGQDTFAPCGPWIVTKDEIPDPHDLRVRSWVNGDPRQDYNTKDMAHKIPDQISWLSRYLQIHPGDVIATGTHHKGLAPVNVGDRLEIDIEKIGRAEWRVTGDMPRKTPKKGSDERKPDPLPPGVSITPV